MLLQDRRASVTLLAGAAVSIGLAVIPAIVTSTPGSLSLTVGLLGVSITLMIDLIARVERRQDANNRVLSLIDAFDRAPSVAPDMEYVAKKAAQVLKDSSGPLFDEAVIQAFAELRLELDALHRGEYTEAADELAMVTPRCPRHEVTKGLLLARGLPDGPEALDLYGSIVPLAVGAGMLQTVASEGPEILDVLEQHPWLAPETWLARVHRAVPPSQRTGVTQIALPGEHLTDRELSVLRMLPSRLTIREIGTELGISVNTVKFHLRVIYRKLGVGSRDEAAAMARSLRRVGHAPRH